MSNSSSSWLFSRGIDLGLLLLPVWACWFLCFSLPETVLSAELPLWVWVIFVLGIDVSHVWSTLHRTYFDKEEFSRYRQLLVLTPIFGFLVVLGLASFSVDWFWRVMAYLALWHFMKQQIGFLQLYRARLGRWTKKLVFRDKWVMYVAMGWPVFYWHWMADRHFSWFVEGDFHLFGDALSDSLGMAGGLIPDIAVIGNFLYWCVIAGWLIEEVIHTIRGKHGLAWGKVLWMLTTAGNWYLGIVYFNSDFAFTITNVVAHGIPYLVLVLFYAERKKHNASPVRVARSVMYVAFMIGSVLLLAFAEELAWDMFLNGEKQAVFEVFFAYPISVLEQPRWQAIALALLSLPQLTHYVIDGFIWKSKLNPHLKPILIRPEA